MQYIKVTPMTSAGTNEPVKNQYIIAVTTCDRTFMFQSYDSLIASYNGTTLTIGAHWDYSKTTVKYFRQFLQTYCPCIFHALPTGKSFSESMRKAIAQGIVKYEPYMI